MNHSNQNANQNNNTIITVVNYQNQNYQYNTQTNKTLNTFYNELCNYFKINPDENMIYYKNNPIKLKQSNKPISKIIDTSKNEYPYFSILPNTQKNNIIPNMRYKSQKNNNNIISKKKKNFSLTHNKNYKSTNTSTSNIQDISEFSAVISGFPSFKEIENILNDFNLKNSNNMRTINHDNNNNNNDYGILTLINNNNIKIKFQTEIKLNEFISYITYVKYENPNFKNMRIIKDYKSIQKHQRNLSQSNNNVRSNLLDFHRMYDYNNTPNINNYKINDVLKAVKQNELNHDFYHGLSLKTDNEDKIIREYYKQQMFLRNSSPYINENEKRILEEKENNKKCWNKKQKFVTSVGKYSMKPNFIPNYVQMTPSENPSNHEFRLVDKKKWITNKGFNP